MWLTYRMKRTGEKNPFCATKDRIPRRDEVVVGKDALNVRPEGRMRLH